MSTAQLTFQFTGTEARKAAEELSGFLSNEFLNWDSQLEAHVPPADGRKIVDPLTITLVILSVPPAIVASWDIAQRIKVKEKVDSLISWAKGRAAREEANPSIMLPPGEQAVPLDKAEPKQILDAIAAQAPVKRDQTAGTSTQV